MSVECGHCGAYPAADVDFAYFTGLVLWHASVNVSGPFCRDCGLHVYRRVTVYAAWFGWWTVVGLITNVAGFVIHARNRRRVAELPTPSYYGWRAPMDPGRPLLRRLGAVGFLIPFAIAANIFVQLYLSDAREIEQSMSTVTSGQCVGQIEVGWWFDREKRWQQVRCADPAAAGRVLLKVHHSPRAADCAGLPTTIFTHTEETFTLCVGPIK
ncbi:hypothetical protein [Nocardia camponoti]|uniref:Uncharacterized protein n=1 Tax=Nocardia camponoti TaxID=1616106 RepID=A0A917V7U4_9NOCA|nr:hypothetical protein [Nocardia camponoti]GGK47537.1 hypothetical protein GCM10011591_18600 [Nocardia camponoti]